MIRVVGFCLKNRNQRIDKISSHPLLSIDLMMDSRQLVMCLYFVNSISHLVMRKFRNHLFQSPIYGVHYRSWHVPNRMSLSMLDMVILFSLQIVQMFFLSVIRVSLRIDYCPLDSSCRFLLLIRDRHSALDRHQMQHAQCQGQHTVRCKLYSHHQTLVPYRHMDRQKTLDLSDPMTLSTFDSWSIWPYLWRE